MSDLAADDVFYFGNAVGDVYAGNVGSPTTVRINASDTGTIRQNQSIASNSVGLESLYDLNRDGRVNATDTAISRQAIQRRVNLFGNVDVYSIFPSPQRKSTRASIRDFALDFSVPALGSETAEAPTRTMSESSDSPRGSVAKSIDIVKSPSEATIVELATIAPAFQSQPIKLRHRLLHP